MSESRTFAKERGWERKHGEEKVNFTVKEGRLQVGEGGCAKRRRSRSKHEGVNERKSSRGGSGRCLVLF